MTASPARWSPAVGAMQRNPARIKQSSEPPKSQSWGKQELRPELQTRFLINQKRRGSTGIIQTLDPNALAERRRIDGLLGNGAGQGTAVLLTEHFWRRGSKFLFSPRIWGRARFRAGPSARHLPESRRDLRARRRLSVAVSRLVTPNSILSLHVSAFNCEKADCDEARSWVLSRVVRLKRLPRSWEY